MKCEELSPLGSIAECDEIENDNVHEVDIESDVKEDTVEGYSDSNYYYFLNQCFHASVYRTC